MMRTFSVKLLLAILLGITVCEGFAQGDRPDPRELLKSARVAQANMDWKFTGHLRVGASAAKIPFFLTVSNGLVKYEFKDNGDSISLRLGEKDSRLEETVGGKTERLAGAKLAAPIRNTNLTYEDISLRFLYWTNAKIVGSDKILTQDCWVIELVPPAQGVSQYSKVKVWISKGDSAVMKMESFDGAGNSVRKYTVRNVMKRDDYWFLKQMEISGGGARKPTYLEFQDVVDN
jgi:hypothetical protein